METSSSKISTLIQQAKQLKPTDIVEALKVLQEASNLIPELARENQQSVRNPTQDRSNLEIQYLSKLGNILYETKEYDEAAKCYEAIKIKLPHNIEIYKAYGDCFRKKGEYKDAIKQYEAGLDVYKNGDSGSLEDQGALLNSKGLAHMGLKEHDLALDAFEAALQTCDKPNPLYLCNKGHALYAKETGDNAEAIEAFKQALDLFKANKTAYGLTKENMTYLETTFRDFLEDLETLNCIKLKGDGDPIIKARENSFVSKNLDALVETESLPTKDLADLSKHNKSLISIKQLKRKIEEDQDLNEYYDGLMFTCSQSFTTAMVVTSGQVSIDTGSDMRVTILKKCVSWLPLVGDQIEDYVQDIYDFAKNAELTKAANNVTKFASRVEDFNAMIQDAIVPSLLDKREIIKQLKVESYLLPKWASRFQPFLDKVKNSKEKIELNLYGERNETPFQKLGYQTAITLISDYVASGKIYEGQPAIRIPPSEKTQKLIKILSDLIDDQTKQHEDSKKPPLSKVNHEETKNDEATIANHGISVSAAKNLQNLSTPDAICKCSPSKLVKRKGYKAFQCLSCHQESKGGTKCPTCHVKLCNDCSNRKIHLPV